MFYVTVLGSGATLPTLQRHTTSVAVQREGDIFLFDCGEGTQLQWLKAGLRRGKLRAICITHTHGDHVNGLVGFLQTLGLHGRERPLTLVGPPGLGKIIKCAKETVGLRTPYHLETIESTGGPVIEMDGCTVSCQVLEHHGKATLGFRVEEAERPGRFDVEAALGLGVPEGPLFGALQRGEQVELPDDTVVDPSQVLGLARPGSALAYCPDTRPCEGALKLAHRVGLLIFDSTYSEELSFEANERGHSTARQAAQMAVDAGANHLLLIHFSERYASRKRLNGLLEEARSLFLQVELAHDLMEIQV
jgi:ribonuclease Z